MTDFQRLLDRRLPRAVKEIQLLSNLSTYKHEPHEAEALIAALEEALQKARERFKLPENKDILPQQQEPTVRAPVAPSHRRALRFFGSKKEVAAELEEAKLRFGFDEDFVRATTELEPSCGWVVVIHATDLVAGLDEFGYELRLVST